MWSRLAKPLASCLGVTRVSQIPQIPLSRTYSSWTEIFVPMSKTLHPVSGRVKNCESPSEEGLSQIRPALKSARTLGAFESKPQKSIIPASLLSAMVNSVA